MRHIVVGTAGHIDHGKSRLVEALTGVDPDRLAEERRRGITIELGFAELKLDAGRSISFVDVPGHERFVRHMVAGASGVDAVLLVIAADQGVQPQTCEHLDICRLLGLRRGLVALTKCDRVDPDLREVVTLEVEELLEGSFLESAPLIPVSATTGLGLDELRAALADLVDALPGRASEGPLRLPVDRVFSQRGFGTVVTGSLVSGALREGDEIEVLPGGGRGRVRGLQRHGETLVEAGPSQRVAVNLQGLELGDVPRGRLLTRPGGLVVRERVWARVDLLEHAAELLGRGGRVRLHAGTAEVGARFRVLGDRVDGARPAEIFLEEGLPLAPGDAVILRRPSPLDTVGGATIVDVDPPARRYFRPEPFRREAQRPDRRLAARLARNGMRGSEPRALAPLLGVTGPVALALLEDRIAGGRARRLANRVYDAGALDALGEAAVAELKRFHREQPLETGMDREALRQAVAPDLAVDGWRAWLADQDGDALRVEGDRIAAADHRVELAGETRALAERLETRLRQAALEPPSLEELLDGEAPEASALVRLLVQQGRLIRLQEGRIFHADAIADLRERLALRAREDPRIDVGAFKELAGVTRKHAIPLLEYLDGERVTRRVGDEREILIR